MVGSSTSASSRESVTCPGAWNESSAIGQRSRKLTVVGDTSSSGLPVPEEKVPAMKGWSETVLVDTRLAAMAMKMVWIRNEAIKVSRRSGDGGEEEECE